MGFFFSKENLGIMVFNDMIRESIKVQGIELVKVGKYEYLGLWISEERHNFKEHERHLSTKNNCNAAIRKHKALWNFNRHEVERGMWKGVMVPGFTFGNAVLCMCLDVQNSMEVK